MRPIEILRAALRLVRRKPRGVPQEPAPRLRESDSARQRWHDVFDLPPKARERLARRRRPPSTNPSTEETPHANQ